MIEEFHSRVAKLDKRSAPLRSTKAKQTETLERRRMALSVLTLANVVYILAVVTGDSGFQLESIGVQRLF